MYDYHLLLQGDAAKANRWLPFARGILHAIHKARFASGGASLVRVLQPEAGVTIRVDSTAGTNRIYIRADGVTWFVTVINVNGATDNTSIYDVFFYTPDRNEYHRAFRLDVADHLDWAPNDPNPQQDVERLGYFHKIIDVSLHDDSVGEVEAEPNWRGFGRFEANPVAKEPNEEDYAYYTLLDTSDGAGPRPSNLQDDGTLPYDTSLLKTNAELREFSPKVDLRIGRADDTEYRAAGFLVNFDNAESTGQHDDFTLFYERQTRAVDSEGEPIGEQTKFDYVAWLNDPAHADIPDPIYFDFNNNFYWRCPRCDESAHFETIFEAVGTYAFAPIPYCDGQYVYYLLDPGIQYHGVSTEGFFMHGRHYLVAPYSGGESNPFDLTPGETFEHRLLFKYEIETDAITKIKGYVDTSYTSESGGVFTTTLFGVETHYPTAFISDDSHDVVGYAETDTVTYDGGSDRAGVYNDTITVYSAPAADLLDESGVTVKNGGIENVEQAFQLDLVALFQDEGDTHNDAGIYNAGSTNLHERPGELMYVEDVWVISGSWTVNADGAAVDNTVYGLSVKRKFGSNPHFAPGALLTWSRADGVTVVYDGGKVNAHEFLGPVAHLGNWAIFGLLVADGPPQVTSGELRTYAVDMTRAWNFTTSTNPSLIDVEVGAKYFDETGARLTDYTYHLLRPAYDARNPDINNKFQPAFSGELSEA